MLPEKIQKKIFEFIDKAKTSFEFENVLTHAGLTDRSRYVEEVFNLLEFDCDLVADNDYYYPKISFLPKIPGRILPNDFELNNGILFAGHRFMPFLPLHIPVDEVTLYINGGKIPKKKIKFKLRDVYLYLSLLDWERIPILNPESLTEIDPESEFWVFDMEFIYKRLGFRSGDTFMFHSHDLEKGIFTLDYDPQENMEKNKKKIQKINKKFLDTLNEIVSQSCLNPSIEKQLLEVYFNLRDLDWTIPGSPFPIILKSQEKIIFSETAYGRKTLHFKDRNPMKDSFLELVDKSLEFPHKKNINILNKIEDILKWLGNNNDEFTVRAFIRNMLYKEKEINMGKIVDYLFAGLEKPFMPDDLEIKFYKLLEKECRRIKKEFKIKVGLMPLYDLREKVLLIHQKISLFLRNLDKKGISPKDLNNPKFVRIMNLDQAINSTYPFFEKIEKEQSELTPDFHTFKKSIETAENALSEMIKELELSLCT